MVYQARVKLSPELTKDRDGTDLRESRSIVEDCVAAYNEAGRRARVPKYIIPESLRLEKDFIEFVLCSEACLTSPTRTVRHLIQLLAKTDYYKQFIHNGRIFRGESEDLGHTQELPPQPEDIPDERVLMDVIRLFFSNTPENRAKIDQIKTVLYENNTQK